MEKLSDIKFNKSVLLIGIGIFGWLTINSFAYILSFVTKDIFFSIGTKPIITIWTQTIVQLTTYVLGILLIINIVKDKTKKEHLIFRNVLLLFILSFLLQLAEPLIPQLLGTGIYMESYYDYFDFLKNSNFYMLLHGISKGVIFIITAILIFINRKELK